MGEGWGEGAHGVIASPSEAIPRESCCHPERSEGSRENPIVINLGLDLLYCSSEPRHSAGRVENYNVNGRLF